MHTVYHTPDGRIFAALASPDPDYELAQRLAGVELRKLTTDQITDGAQARACCESGRVHAGKIVFGAEDVGAVTRAVAIDEVRAAVRATLAEELIAVRKAITEEFAAARAGQLGTGGPA